MDISSRYGAVDGIFQASWTEKQKTASDKDDEDNENWNIAEEEGIEVDASNIMNNGTNLDIKSKL